MSDKKYTWFDKYIIGRYYCNLCGVKAGSKHYCKNCIDFSDLKHSWFSSDAPTIIQEYIDILYSCITNKFISVRLFVEVRNGLIMMDKNENDVKNNKDKKDTLNSLKKLCKKLKITIRKDDIL